MILWATPLSLQQKLTAMPLYSQWNERWVPYCVAKQRGEEWRREAAQDGMSKSKLVPSEWSRRRYVKSLYGHSFVSPLLIIITQREGRLTYQATTPFIAALCIPCFHLQLSLGFISFVVDIIDATTEPTFVALLPTVFTLQKWVMHTDGILCDSRAKAASYRLWYM